MASLVAQEDNHKLPCQMPVTIRPYEKTDKEACMKAFQTNVPAFFTPQEALDYAQWLDTKPFEPNLHYYVITSDGDLVGCGGFVFQPENNEAIFVWGLVDQSRHRAGFGKQLLQFRLDEINRLYPDAAIKLDTTQFSFPFFEKLGFRVDKITRDFYAPGYDRYDMTLSINHAETHHHSL